MFEVLISKENNKKVKIKGSLDKDKMNEIHETFLLTVDSLVMKENEFNLFLANYIVNLKASDLMSSDIVLTDGESEKFLALKLSRSSSTSLFAIDDIEFDINDEDGGCFFGSAIKPSKEHEKDRPDPSLKCDYLAPHRVLSDPDDEGAYKIMYNDVYYPCSNKIIKDINKETLKIFGKNVKSDTDINAIKLQVVESMSAELDSMVERSGYSLNRIHQDNVDRFYSALINESDKRFKSFNLT